MILACVNCLKSSTDKVKQSNWDFRKKNFDWHFAKWNGSFKMSFSSLCTGTETYTKTSAWTHCAVTKNS